MCKCVIFGSVLSKMIKNVKNVIFCQNWHFAHFGKFGDFMISMVLDDFGSSSWTASWPESWFPSAYIQVYLKRSPKVYLKMDPKMDPKTRSQGVGFWGVFGPDSWYSWISALRFTWFPSAHIRSATRITPKSVDLAATDLSIWQSQPPDHRLVTIWIVS